MNTREVAVVAIVVLLGVAGAALPTVAATAADTAVQANETNQSATATDATGNESGNASAAFGDQMTAFMQSSAAETNDTVESGMWKAGFERANESEKARMATDRTDTLEQRLERLRERNETLTEQYENGSLSRSEYVARASELSGRIASLRTSIDETDRAVEQAGVNETRLDDLREDARNMSGPHTAGVARDVVAGGQGPPADRDTGPDAGPGSDDGVDLDNASVGTGDEAGPSDSTDGNVTNGGGNANPSDGGVGTGDDGDNSGETSDGNDDSDGANAGNGNGESGDGDAGNGDGANPGNGNGVAGGDDDDSGDESDGDEDSGDNGNAGNGENGNDGNGNGNGGNGNAGNGNTGNSDYTWLADLVGLP